MQEGLCWEAGSRTWGEAGAAVVPSLRDSLSGIRLLSAVNVLNHKGRGSGRGRERERKKAGEQERESKRKRAGER